MSGEVKVFNTTIEKRLGLEKTGELVIDLKQFLNNIDVTHVPVEGGPVLRAVKFYVETEEGICGVVKLINDTKENLWMYQ